MNKDGQYIADAYMLIQEFFNGDGQKIITWYKTKNPLFADMAPKDYQNLNPRRFYDVVYQQRNGIVP